jgi:hypothetical protein
VLQVELLGFFGEIRPEVFLSEHRLGQSFNTFDGFEVSLARAVLALLEADIVELLHLAAVVGILGRVGRLPEV